GHTEHALPGGQQVVFEAARHLPAVLDRPDAFVAEPARPRRQFEMVRAGGAGGAFAEFASELVGGDGGVLRLCVSIPMTTMVCVSCRWQGIGTGRGRSE